MRALKRNKSALELYAGGRKRRTRSFGRNTLEDIVDKGVQDGHRLVGDTSVRVHLLEHCKSKSGHQGLYACVEERHTLVDVRGVSLLAGLLALLLLAVTT